MVMGDLHFKTKLVLVRDGSVGVQQENIYQKSSGVAIVYEFSSLESRVKRNTTWWLLLVDGVSIYGVPWRIHP